MNSHKFLFSFLVFLFLNSAFAEVKKNIKKQDVSPQNIASATNKTEGYRRSLCLKFGGTYVGGECQGLRAAGLDPSLSDEIGKEQKKLDSYVTMRRSRIKALEDAYKLNCPDVKPEPMTWGCRNRYNDIAEKKKVLTQKLNNMVDIIKADPQKAKNNEEVKALQAESKKLQKEYQDTQKACPSPAPQNTALCKREKAKVEWVSKKDMKTTKLENRTRFAIIRICKATGGKWNKFESSCTDKCQLFKDPNCEPRQIYGCDCGEDRCAFENQCVKNPQWHHAG